MQQAKVSRRNQRRYNRPREKRNGERIPVVSQIGRSNPKMGKSQEEKDTEMTSHSREEEEQPQAKRTEKKKKAKK